MGEAAGRFREGSALAEPGEQGRGLRGGDGSAAVRASGVFGVLGGQGHPCSSTERGRPVCKEPSARSPCPESELPEERAGISGNLFAW